MTSKLITYDFADEFNDILLSTEQQVKIVSPFIGFKTANILSSFLDRNGSVECKIITRFYREDFIQNVSSIHGLYNLVNSQAKVLALQDLHTKLYLFDSFAGILGSANFTMGGFYHNLFLASINPSSAELNFPSTPFPLMGFHGRMC